MSDHGNPKSLDAQVNPAHANLAFKVGLVVGVAGVAASAAALALGEEAKHQFFMSWLVACVTFTTIALGGLFFTVLHHLVRASWSAGLRRSAENLAMNLPLMALLFVPVLVGLHDIYHWSHEDVVAQDPILQWKAGYLNAPFFMGRTALYFVIWAGLAYFYRKHSRAQDDNGDPALTFKMRSRAPIAILLFALSITFAGFDWLMSLDPHWFSTIFGVHFFAGSLVSFLATLALTALWLTRGEGRSPITVGNLHDVGKLLFGFTVFWTYISFSQYFLIWYANIPEETIWYQVRMSHGWQNIASLVVAGHFLVPFAVLMSRKAKRNRTVLGLTAFWMLLMHFVDIYLIAMPTMHESPQFHWLDLSTLIGVGSLFFAFFIRRYANAPAVPIRDPQLIAALEYDNA